jgi:SAM-dependent methyltransferase
MDKKEIISILQNLYSDINPLMVSVNYRNTHNITDKSFVYGEILPEEFMNILDLVEFSPETIFYDLGSGSGKAVITAYLYKKPKKAIGIEYIPDLVEIAKKAVEKLENLLKIKTSIEFLQGDIRDFDFSDADIIFSHATCFSDELMKDLHKKIQNLKKGAKFIIVTKEINDKIWELKGTYEFSFSWGTGTVRIYEKID